MKDIIIFGLIAYIFYDRYMKEDEYKLLQSDLNKLNAKIEQLKQSI